MKGISGFDYHHGCILNHIATTPCRIGKTLDILDRNGEPTGRDECGANMFVWI